MRQPILFLSLAFSTSLPSLRALKNWETARSAQTGRCRTNPLTRDAGGLDQTPMKL